MFKLHKEEIIDLSDKKNANDCWDEMADCGNSLKAIISDLKTFEASFHSNYYMSDKPSMSDKWLDLEAMLSEFKEELESTQKNVCDFYK